MTIGILGAGQLGRMLALAAQPLGINCIVYDPASDPCAAQVTRHFRGEFEDFQTLFTLVQACDAVTLEFENVPVESALWIAERRPFAPSPYALEVSQDRLTEKNFFRSLNIPTPPFASVENREDYDRAIHSIGLPAVLKTRRFGYDGKGQEVIRTAADVAHAWEALGGRALILEGFVRYQREFSTIAARGQDGRIVIYPPTENEHREGMLHKSIAPAPEISQELVRESDNHIRSVMSSLQYVGVLAIEWFEVDGRPMANEMAPRVHNSGHWTIDGAVTSQFENHIRAVAGLPLGSTAAKGHSVMFNWIGTHPPIEDVLQMPEAKVHWYGKDPRTRRKIGHVTFNTRTREELDSLIRDYESRFGS